MHQEVRARPVVGDRAQVVDLDAQPILELTDASLPLDRVNGSDTDRPAPRAAVSLVSIADEIRAQQMASQMNWPMRGRRPAGPRLDASAQGPARSKHHLVLITIAGAVLLSWALILQSAPRGFANAQEAPRERDRARWTYHFAIGPDHELFQRPISAFWSEVAEADANAKASPNEVSDAAGAAPQVLAAARSQEIAPDAAPLRQYVATNKVTTIRAEPDMRAATSRVLPAKVILTIFQKKEDWLEVGSTYAWGWVQSGFVYPYDPGRSGPS
jgi:hypothetical protein